MRASTSWPVALADLQPRGGHQADTGGGFETLPISAVPPAGGAQARHERANLIGDGLYGVDVKQFGDRAVVIEVNDNPSIDEGVEDAYLGEDLYRRIMEEFLRRLERKERCGCGLWVLVCPAPRLLRGGADGARAVRCRR
jgi:hypothetical protein